METYQHFNAISQVVVSGDIGGTNTRFSVVEIHRYNAGSIALCVAVMFMKRLPAAEIKSSF
jgi:glucokinase